MNANPIALPANSYNRIYTLSIVLVLIFFALVFYFRNNLEDMTIPFTGLFLGIGAVMLVSRRFEALILLILVITSTVFKSIDFPTIPVATFDLNFTDPLIMGLIAGQILKRITVEFRLIPRPLGWPVMAMIAAAFFSFAYSIVGFNVSIARAGIELRTLFHLSLFFVVYHYIKSPRQLKTLLMGLAIIACINAVLLIVQYALGYEISIIGGRVGVLSTAGISYDELTRVLIPGVGMIIFTLNALVSIYVLRALKRKNRPILLPAISLLILSLILTFTRSFWVAILFSIIIVLFILRHRMSLYPRIFSLAGGALLVILFMLQANVFNTSGVTEAVSERTMSIVQAHKNFRNDTLYMRYLESRMAWAKITEHPLLGIGLGNSYRQRMFGNTDYEKVLQGTIVHNGYLAVQLKMGLMGTIAFFALIGLFMYRTFAKWRKVKDPLYQAIVLGVFASGCSLLILNFFSSTFLSVPWVAVIAVAMGITERIYRFEEIA